MACVTPTQNIYEFARLRGLVTDADVQGHTHAGLRSAPQTKTYKRFYERKLLELLNAWGATKKAYEAAIEAGEILRPARRTTEEIAQGHPDLASTQAALRILAKREARKAGAA